MISKARRMNVETERKEGTSRETMESESVGIGRGNEGGSSGGWTLTCWTRFNEPGRDVCAFGLSSQLPLFFGSSWSY